MKRKLASDAAVVPNGRYPPKRWPFVAGPLRDWNIDWPIAAGLLAVACGIAMLVAAWGAQRLAGQLESRSKQSSTVSSDAPGGKPSSAARGDGALKSTSEISLPLPAPSSHDDDLRFMFQLARERGVGIGAIQYEWRRDPVLPILVRTLSLRVNEDYPKLKPFIAQLLERLTHLSVQEFRIERKDATSAQGLAVLKLSFVYQEPSGSGMQTR